MYHVSDSWTLKWVLSECKAAGVDSLFGKTFFGNKYPKRVDNRVNKALCVATKSRVRDIFHNVEKSTRCSPFREEYLEKYRRILGNFKV